MKLISVASADSLAKRRPKYILIFYSSICRNFPKHVVRVRAGLHVHGATERDRTPNEEKRRTLALLVFPDDTIPVATMTHNPPYLVCSSLPPPLRQKFLATIDLSLSLSHSRLGRKRWKGQVQEIEHCRQDVEETKKEDARTDGVLGLSTTRTKRNVQTKLHSFVRAEWQPRAEEC